MYLCGINNKSMAKRINFKAALAESIVNKSIELHYTTYGLPRVVFVEARKYGEFHCGGWLSAEYVKKTRRAAGLAARFDDETSKNA